MHNFESSQRGHKRDSLLTLMEKGTFVTLGKTQAAISTFELIN